MSDDYNDTCLYCGGWVDDAWFCSEDCADDYDDYQARVSVDA